PDPTFERRALLLRAIGDGRVGERPAHEPLPLFPPRVALGRKVPERSAEGFEHLPNPEPDPTLAKRAVERVEPDPDDAFRSARPAVKVGQGPELLGGKIAHRERPGPAGARALKPLARGLQQAAVPRRPEEIQRVATRLTPHRPLPYRVPPPGARG